MTPHPWLLQLKQLQYSFRALGLDLVLTIFRAWNAWESPKPVFRESRWIALSHCMVHICPCIIFSYLIYLNHFARYLGPGFSPSNPDGLFLALFQIAAKLLEVLCVASLTTVILHALRHDLQRGGVPLGFLGSGLYFSQVSCFWSPEMFIGAVRCARRLKGCWERSDTMNWKAFWQATWNSCKRSWERIRLFVIVVVAATIAVLVGPSSAVLLIPRAQIVPAGGTNYYLPVTPDQLWPSIVDGDDELPECFTEASPQQMVCASGGFASLRGYFRDFNTSFHLLPTMLKSGSSVTPIVVHTSAAKVPSLLNQGFVFGITPKTMITQPNAFTAIMQDSLNGDWRNITRYQTKSLSQYQYAAEQVSSVSTTNPVVHVKCSVAHNVSAGQSEVTFPVRSWTGDTPDANNTWENIDEWFNVSLPDAGISNYIHADWVSLPTEQFGAVSGGILLSFPGTLSMNSLAVVGCSVSASWINSEISSDSEAYDGAWLVSNLAMPDKIYEIRNDLNASSSTASSFQRLITIRDRWFRSLTPPAMNRDRGNSSQLPNTLQRILSDVGLSTTLHDMRTQPMFTYHGKTSGCLWDPPDLTITDVDRLNYGACYNGAKKQLLELILASTFANGLSRYGSRRAFEPLSMTSKKDAFGWILKSPPKAPNYDKILVGIHSNPNAVLPPPPSSNFVNLTMVNEVNGYAWYASTSSEYLATAVIGFYILVALVHTIWVLSRGITSSSWDTATELLALAMQSPAALALNGSGAGVQRGGTYERTVALRTARDGGLERENVSERLVLVVEEGSSEQVGEEERNTTYSVREGLKRMSSMTAVATSSITSSFMQGFPKEDETRKGARYRKVEIDKKYL